MEDDQGDEDDEEDDGLTEALTDLQQQLNSDLSRVEAAVVAEEGIEVRLSGTAEPSTSTDQGRAGGTSVAATVCMRQMLCVLWM